MARARAPGSLLFYFCQLYRASSCWYFCWYRQLVRFVGIFVGISGEQTFAAAFAIPNKGIEQKARKNDGACANPKLIRTDVDCRAARPKFDKGAWSPAKIQDAHNRMIWTHKGMSNWYRNAQGRVVVTTPFRNDANWHAARKTDLNDFIVGRAYSAPG